MKRTRCFAAVIIMLCAIGLSAQPAPLALGETVYVPAYASIFHGDMKWEMNLTVTLSIHNVDMKRSIVIDTIHYYDSSGKMVKNYCTSKITLRPLETYNLGIKDDAHDGMGANFIVRWYAPAKVNRPIIETIMIGTKGQQGISFTSRGEAIAP